MKGAWTVFRKELREALRDRRTVLVTFILPVFFYPLIVLVMGYFSSLQMSEVKGRALAVPVLPGEKAVELNAFVEEYDGISFTPAEEEADLRRQVQAEEVPAALLFDEQFERAQAQGGTGKISLLYKETAEGTLQARRIRDLLKRYQEAEEADRFRALGLLPSAVEPIDLTLENVAEVREESGEQLGGVLAYFLFFLCLTGCMSTAVDQGAGEKERGTLETLLSTPMDQRSVLVGKLGLVMLAGLCSSLLSILSLGGLAFLGGAANNPEYFGSLLQVSNVALAIALLIPVSLVLASLLLGCSFFARSPKEAQGYLSPILMALALGLVVAMLPGTELNVLTALIPVFNAAVVLREGMSGSLVGGHVALTFVSLLGFSALAIWSTVRLVEREATLFRD
ncbi:MAG: ABC transporter permease [Verrucomicrobiota bacterium]